MNEAVRESLNFAESLQVNLSDYTYSLPQEKIANYPLSERDASKLLVYKDGNISHSAFSSLPDQLPGKSFLFFNNTKVIPARLHFQKASGAVIEIFLLNPVSPSTLIAETMVTTGHCSWHCTIGNLKRWTEDLRLKKEIAGVVLTAALIDRQGGIVEFTWPGGKSFAEMIHLAGDTPLPPYIRRKAESGDRERYQTIYSHFDGAVAAPTAGLHFTPEVFAALQARNVGHDFVTLHVSAGTFQPIKTENPEDHVMHQEQVIISRTNLRNLMAPDRFIVAVGTTSMRTLESIYWYGAKLLDDPESDFNIGQRDPYQCPHPPPTPDALSAVAAYMDRHQLQTLIGETSIFIRPGYTFRVCQALITNFHQPGSTLILLVAAFVGEDWRKLYDEALKNNYRFLSYGDSSLLIP